MKKRIDEVAQKDAKVLVGEAPTSPINPKSRSDTQEIIRLYTVAQISARYLSNEKGCTTKKEYAVGGRVRIGFAA